MDRETSQHPYLIKEGKNLEVLLLHCFGVQHGDNSCSLPMKCRRLCFFLEGSYFRQKREPSQWHIGLNLLRRLKKRMICLLELSNLFHAVTFPPTMMLFIFPLNLC